MRYPWVPDGKGTTAEQRIAVWPAGQEGPSRHSRPKLSTQPRPELRPQAGPEVRREPTSSPMLPRLCWCAARGHRGDACTCSQAASPCSPILPHLSTHTPQHPAPSRTSVRNSTWCRLLPHQTCISTRPDLRACITHTHAACLALPCLALDSATRPLAPDEFS